MQTNRDLYLAICKLAEQHAKCTRSLEDYLRALLAGADAFSGAQALSLQQFHGLLSNSFVAQFPEFTEELTVEDERDERSQSNYKGWRARLVRQIIDLRDMKANGTFTNKLRYFGVKSPSGRYWFNFDPVTFIECATEGSMGGWEPGDDTERNFVPGNVASVNEDGTVGSARPEDLARPHVEMPLISWQDFRDFLWCGQNYE